MSDTKQETGGNKKTAASTKPTKSGAASRGARTSNRATTPKPPRPTKSASVLALLRSKKGASIEEMVEATGWQTHSVRGFLSGMVKKKLGLALESAKDKAGVRKYRIAAGDNAGADADASPKRGSGKSDVNNLTPSS